MNSKNVLKNSILLVYSFANLAIYAQDGFNMQFVVRDSKGHEIINDSAKIECIWGDSVNNTIVVETYFIHTNQFGLCTLHIDEAIAKIIKPYWDYCANYCAGKIACYCNGLTLNTRFYNNKGELLSTQCQSLNNTVINHYGNFLHLGDCGEKQ